MKKPIAMNVSGLILSTIAVIWLAGGVMTGCARNGEKPGVIDVEKIIDFTGEIKITLPAGEIKSLKVGDKLFPLPEKTLIEVISKECTGTLGDNIIILKMGQIARIIKPGVTAQRIIQFTGELKIILPDGTVIFVKAGEPLPILPPGTRIEVISGDLIVIWEDEKITLIPGDIAWIETPVQEEADTSESGDISPVSPFQP